MNKNTKPNEATQLMEHIYNIGKEEDKSDIQNWEYFEEIYKSCLQGLVGIANEITTQIRQAPELLQYVPSPSEVKLAMKTLAADTQTLAANLKQIHDAHSLFSGPIVGAQANADSIQIFEMYVAFQQRFNALIIPNASLIAEQLGFSADRLTALYANDNTQSSETAEVEQEKTQTLN